MVKALDNLADLSEATPRTRSLQSIRTLRARLGLIILLGSIISLLGTSWDIQWHSLIERDRTLIAPHIMLLSGITISGIAVLAAVLIETVWVRRNPLLVKYSTNFAGFFYSSLGSYIAGFGALDAAIAFPLDSYWHALYGVDVNIWAPFHVMILTGGALIPLGAAYMWVSVAQMTANAGDEQATRRAYLGATIAFATMLGVFTILLSDASDDPGYITIGNITFNLFPLFSGLLVAWALTSVIYAIPQRRAARNVVLFYLAFIPLFSVFIPPATNYLMGLEHLAFREDVGIFSLLSLTAVRFWPLAPIIVAILLDRSFFKAKEQGWSARKLTIRLSLISLIACLPVVVLFPPFFVFLIIQLGFIGFPISMLLGALGTFTGTWLGQRTSMQEIEGGE